MKKILTISVLFFAFTLSSSAQTETAKAELTIEEKISQNMMPFMSYMDMDNNTSQVLHTLFEMKYYKMKEGISDADRKAVIAELDAKLRATIHPEVIKQMEEKNVYSKMLNMN